MATFEKRGNKWRVAVCVDRVRDSKTFDTKREAIAWANEQEQSGILARHTLAEAVEKYHPISEAKKGWQSELSRLKSLSQSTLARLPLESLTASHIASWRDERLKTLAPVSVRREMIVLGSVLRTARDEWGWLRHDPMVKKPPVGKARQRGITQDEIDKILENLKHTKMGPQVSAMFLLSIETGLRLSELLSIRWLDVRDKSLTIRESKNGDSRVIPLSVRAREVIETRNGIDAERVFTLSPHTASKTFARHSVAGVHFHDARSEAITRLSKKLDVLQLAKMIGHRDLKSLMHYYAESAEQIADKLG